MKTAVERIDQTRVKLTVEVEPERVRAAFNEAARHLAADVNIPGFRKGKAPRRLIEARVGQAALAQHAMDHEISAYYTEALKAASVSPVAQPQIDLQRFSEEEGCAFEA